MRYAQVLKNLSRTINAKRNGNTAENFKMCLKDLYNNFKIELSTKFLRTLVNSDRTNRQITNRIRYLIRRAGLKTQRRNRYFDDWANQHYKKDIVEYEHKKGLVYPTAFNDVRYLFNEFMIIEDVRNKENDFKSDKDKLNLRNAINKGSSVYVKNIREEEVSNFFKTHEKEVLFFIVGF